MKKHRRPAALRHLVPGAFVFALLAVPALALFAPVFWYLWFASLGSYAVANLAASVLTAAGKGWRCLFALPVVFGCYHFGYGIGFLRGVISFLILRRGPSATFTRLTRAA